MRKRCTLLGLLILTSLSLLLLSSCGGGGGTSAINPAPVNPTSIPTTIPTAPNSGTISGIITNALDGSPISGAELKSNGSVVATSDNNGHYSFQGSSGQLIISGGSAERTVYFNSTSPVKNISLIPKEINIDNFWSHFKRNDERIIYNWKNKPSSIVVFTKTIDADNRVSQDIIDNTVKILNEKFVPFFGSEIPVFVVETKPQEHPDIQMSSANDLAYFSNGNIAIGFYNILINADGKGRSIIGNDGYLCGGGITVSLVSKAVNNLDHIILHELGHAIFRWYHPFENTDNPSPSIMNYDSTIKNYTDFDTSIWTIQRKRETKTSYPDNDPDNSENYSSKILKENELIFSDNF